MNFGSNNQTATGNNFTLNSQPTNTFNGFGNMSSIPPINSGFPSTIGNQNSMFGAKTESMFGNPNPNQFNNPIMTANNQSSSLFGNNANPTTNLSLNATPATNQQSIFNSNGTNNIFGNSNQNTFGINQGPSSTKSLATFATPPNTTTSTFSFSSPSSATSSANNMFGSQAMPALTNTAPSINFGANTTNVTSNNFNTGFQNSTTVTPQTNASQSIFGNTGVNNTGSFQFGTTPQISNPTSITNSFNIGNTNTTAAPAVKFGNQTSNPFGANPQTITTTTGAMSFGTFQSNVSVAQTSTPSVAPAFQSIQTPIMAGAPTTSLTGFTGNTFGSVTTGTIPSPFSAPLSAASAPKSAATVPLFNLNPTATVSVAQPIFGLPNTTGLGGIATAKLLPNNNASPLAANSISAKKGLGGSPIFDSSKSVLSKDAAQKSSIVKQVKDTELLPELRETVETFTKFVTEQKKLREEIIKSNDVASLMMRVEEESQTLRQSISEVANGLQKVQVQSNKLRSDIAKEQSSIKIAQTSSDTSMSMAIDRSDSSNYFSGKVRDLENRAGLYLQEIESVESLCQSPHQSALTTRDLVEIIRKMDDEFIGLAANLYMVHERVKLAKTEYLRRVKQVNQNHQNPFVAIEGRFGETFDSIGAQRQPTATRGAAPKASDTIGGSPFDSSCYMNHVPSFNCQKPSIFGLGSSNNNTSQPLMSSPAATTSNQFFSNNSTPSFGITKPTNLFLTDTVSNKKRR